VGISGCQNNKKLIVPSKSKATRHLTCLPLSGKVLWLRNQLLLEQPTTQKWVVLKIGKKALHYSLGSRFF
jgi:hypothetical protein